ncbi:unnamed protein product [Mycena citricolor]|uniref:Uncharacterized protein n=1 Tax=Mycena citricolor TaxID=2018698 RepID=A0AAD2GX09_9AGAR|nr:unnamed protein product [Mycena citricolor]
MPNPNPGLRPLSPTALALIGDECFALRRSIEDGKLARVVSAPYLSNYIDSAGLHLIKLEGATEDYYESYDLDEDGEMFPPWAWLRRVGAIAEKVYTFNFVPILCGRTCVRPPRRHALLRHTEDGKRTLLKYVGKDKFTREGHIVQRLLSEPLWSDSRNKTPYIQVLDVGRSPALCAALQTFGSSVPHAHKLSSTEDFLSFYEQITEVAIHYQELPMLIPFAGNRVSTLARDRSLRCLFAQCHYGVSSNYTPSMALDGLRLLGFMRDPRSIGDEAAYRRWGLTMEAMRKDSQLDLPPFQELIREMTAVQPTARPAMKIALHGLAEECTRLKGLLACGDLGEMALGSYPVDPVLTT